LTALTAFELVKAVKVLYGSRLSLDALGTKTVGGQLSDLLAQNKYTAWTQSKSCKPSELIMTKE